jgi:glycosyltransferase involved in cell wall biosynthesis
MLRRIIRDLALRILTAGTQSRLVWPFMRILPRSLRQHAKDTFHSLSPVSRTPLTIIESNVEKWQDKPLLSVIVACYNYGQFIREALQSAASQTFRDYEIVVVDDGSADDLTLRTLNELAHEGVRVLRQEHSGPAGARNCGISVSAGKYVCCLDADDTIEPTYFEKCLALLESNPGITFAYSLLKTFGTEQRIGVTKPFDLRLLLAYNHVAGSSIFGRAAWTAVGGFDSSMPAYVDWDFWIKLGENGYRGMLIPEPLLNWRRHPHTLGRSVDERKPELIARIRANHADLYSNPDRVEEIQQQYRDFHVANPFINLAATNQYAQFKEPTWLIIITEPPQPELLSFLSELREHGVALISIATCSNLTRMDRQTYLTLTPVYDLAAFLEKHYWLSFIINLISTRSIQFVLLYGSAASQEWTAEIKNRFPAIMFNSLHNPKRDPDSFRQERSMLSSLVHAFEKRQSRM